MWLQRHWQARSCSIPARIVVRAVRACIYVHAHASKSDVLPVPTHTTWRTDPACLQQQQFCVAACATHYMAMREDSTTSCFSRCTFFCRAAHGVVCLLGSLMGHGPWAAAALLTMPACLPSISCFVCTWQAANQQAARYRIRFCCITCLPPPLFHLLKGE